MSPGPKTSAALSNKTSMEGATEPALAALSRRCPWLISTSRFEGTTKITPSSSASRSSTTRTGNVVWRARISCRWLGLRGSRCWAITIGAGKSAGRLATTRESASMPPAEDPITTS